MHGYNHVLARGPDTFHNDVNRLKANGKIIIRLENLKEIRYKLNEILNTLFNVATNTDDEVKTLSRQLFNIRIII